VANILSALLWAPMHIFPGVLVGLAPELSFAAVGVLILAWIAWSMIKRKTARIMDCSDNQDAAGASPTDRTGQREASGIR
jgi:hypothetical protein